MYLSKKAI